MSQKAFLCSSYAKQKLIDIPTVQQEEDDHTVVRCTGEADTVLAFTILDHGCTGSNVQLNGADTDLLIMFIYSWNNFMGEIVMKPEATKKY